MPSAETGNSRQPRHPGSQVFDQAAARTGLRDHEAAAVGFDPVTTGSQADDHKACYPGSHPITMRVTGDRATGLQLSGQRHAEIAKRVDIAVATIFHGMTVDAVSDLDLSYTPPLGSPWDAIQIGAQTWEGALPPAARSAQQDHHLIE
jgi:NADPH-dependent 2,4-dienoyl-CoA reductase/sulfur reductase-like enzyme